MSNQPKGAERRHFFRVVFCAPATLTVGEYQAECRVLDVSLKGALVTAADSVAGQPGDACILKIELAPPDVVVCMDGRIAHREGERIGIHCIEIDLDSIEHLRRLIELHLASDDLLQRELAALVAEHA